MGETETERDGKGAFQEGEVHPCLPPLGRDTSSCLLSEMTKKNPQWELFCVPGNVFFTLIISKCFITVDIPGEFTVIKRLDGLRGFYNLKKPSTNQICTVSGD